MNERHPPCPALDVEWRASAGAVPLLQELLAAALDDLETTGVHEQDSSWRVFFPSRAARARAAGALNRRFRALGVVTSAVEVGDEDWARRSQAGLGPVRVGRVVVAPPWAAVRGEAPAGPLVIRILPSMGFGTGHHATTRLCLRAIQAIDLAGRSFLDIGTGSGVLAIAALRLGAGPVIAIDSDQDAIASARVNLELNGVSGRVRLLTGDFRRLSSAPVRAAVANLTGAALLRESQDIVRRVEPGGVIVVSGFTSTERDTVLSALSQAARIVRTYTERGWGAAVLEALRRPEGRRE